MSRLYFTILIRILAVSLVPLTIGMIVFFTTTEKAYRANIDRMMIFKMQARTTSVAERMRDHEEKILDYLDMYVQGYDRTFRHLKKLFYGDRDFLRIDIVEDGGRVHGISRYDYVFKDEPVVEPPEDLWFSREESDIVLNRVFRLDEHSEDSGYILASMSMRGLMSELSDNPNEEYPFFIVDASGTLIYHQQFYTLLAGLSYQDSELIANLRPGNTRKIFLNTIHNPLTGKDETRFTVLTHLVGTPYFLGIDVSRQQVMTYIGTVRVMMVMVGIAFVLSIVLVSYGITSSITDPIDKLVEMTDRYGKGETALAGYSFPNNEIGELAERFQEMVKVRLTHEETLRASEERYRSLFHNPETVMMVIDPASGRIIEANTAAMAYYGYTERELTSMSIRDINTMDDERIRQGLAKAASGKQEQHHFRHRLASGEERDVEVFSAPIEIDNRPMIVTIIHDITDRTNAIAEMNRLAEFNRLILDAAGEAIMGIDAKGNISFVNPALCRITGYEAEELIGSCHHEILHSRHTDGSAYPMSECPIHSTIVSGKTIRGQEYYWRKDGTMFPIEFASAPIMQAGNVIGAVVVLSDVSERLATEASLNRQRALVEKILATANAFIVMLDRKGTIIHFNIFAEQLTGWKMEEVIGSSWIDNFIKESDRAMVSEWIDSVYKEDAFVAQAENDILTRDGSTRTIVWRNSMLNSAEGDGFILSVGLDITEKKQIEDQLHRRTVELEELNSTLEKRILEEIEHRRRNEQILMQQSKLAAMGEMIGAIAHQWRQPLNVIALLIQDMEDAYEFGQIDDAYVNSLIERTMRQVNHMSRTIDDFRNFFRPVRDRTDFNAVSIVEDAMNLVGAQLKHLSIDTEVVVDEGVDAILNSYPNEFAQVMVNVVNNAKDAIVSRTESMKHVEGYRGRITVEITGTDEKIVVTVSDNGGGIDPAIIDRIFEPYFTTKPQGKGTGIGLYMSKIIIEDNMQGAIACENTGDGAKFIIEIPRATT